MSRTSRFLVTILAVLLLAGVITLAPALRHGFSAHDNPTVMEQVIARQLRHWAVPADLRRKTNPIRMTPAVLAESRAHFADHCAICHGNDGKGQTDMGQHMYPRAPDMTLARTQDLSDGELFGIIEDGIRLTGMPAWGNGTAESRRASWSLVHFIRHLPKITPEEIEEMEKLNPKTPDEYEEMQQEERFLEGSESPQPQTHHH